jgi:hypothetical protein
MGWHSFGEASKEFGAAVSKALSLILFYVFTFAWITVPIFSALFTETLAIKGSEGHVITAIGLWITIGAFHVCGLAYTIGVIATKRNRIVDFAKEIWENEWKRSSRTD